MDEEMIVEKGGGMTEVKYAGFWQRFVAFLLDGIILAAFQYVFTILSLGILVVPIYICGGWLYFALMQSSNKQATFGKLAMGIIVTDMNGNKISFGRASARYFTKILSSLILMIGYLMAGFTAKKQALHDLIAETLVVKR